MVYVTLAGGAYLILIALMMSTKNLQSFLLFRAIPFFLGLGTFMGAVKALGWL